MAIITGTGADETLVGTGRGDVINGLDGNDVLIGKRGADELNGGAGRDLASYRTADAGVGVELVSPQANFGDAEGDTYISIENLEGSRFEDHLGGNAAANKISGGKGNDGIFGNEGDDILRGEAGDDNLDGGFQDVGQDRLYGGNGNDGLAGFEGDDFLEGGKGADILNGGEGSDTYFYSQLKDSTVDQPDRISDLFSNDFIDVRALNLGGQGAVTASYDPALDLTYFMLDEGEDGTVDGLILANGDRRDFLTSDHFLI